MGKIFAVVVVAVAIATAYFVAAHVYWMPEDISVHGHFIDEQIVETTAGAGVLFLLGQFVLAAFVFLYGDSKGRRKLKAWPGGAKPLIWAAIVLIGIEILTLSFIGSKAWGAVYFSPVEPGALPVDVQAEQFAFYFRYAGPDGRFGATHPELIDEGSQNYFGLDPANDVAARDDIVVGSLTIPVNKPILLTLHSKDVGHSFYVRELRIQQDFVPGITIPIHFTATKTGKYEIVCTQLCGLGHYIMRAYLNVVSQDEFDQWLKAQSSGQ